MWGVVDSKAVWDGRMGLEPMIYGEQSYILPLTIFHLWNLIPLKSKEVSRVERVNNHSLLLYNVYSNLTERRAVCAPVSQEGTDDRLLARHNEPLNFVRHHEDLQRNALEEVEVNQDPLLARDPTNPMLIKEVTAAQKVSSLTLVEARSWWVGILPEP